MKKILFLILLSALFLYGCASTEKTEETTENRKKVVARGTITIEIPNSTTVQGSLDKKVINEYVRKILPKLRFCYENGLKKNPELAGGVVVKFVIQENGSVGESKVVETTMNNLGVEKCIADQVGKIEFPKPKCGIVIVTYPFVFKNKEW